MSDVTAETLLTVYAKATLIKQTDERIRSLLGSGALAISYYSPRGQEIVAAATALSLRPEDYVVTTYRGAHDQIAKGLPLRLLFAELFGKSTGACKGKGGSMHITHPESGIMLTTGVVGSGLPIANGLALASQIRDDGRVTVVNFGDGATNIGAFHESLNMASLWKLPIVFLCQNNGYAEHTTYANGTTSRTVADRAQSYQMPGVTVDGNDPTAMFLAARDAIECARSGRGPTLLEAKTFRFMGHFYGDDSSYIDQGIYDDFLGRDPVPALRAALIAGGHASESDLSAIESASESEIQDALQFAIDSPDPELAEIGRDIYATEVGV
ncbi:thiamine pyrophosphate-dependent dehydrogenase E1 component subunit alpha [Mycolicibacterium hodleri]|uniref:Thiamine pyrophosphate-dependent dehydrogenase E1 component subunit alpha n=1 Tax=Mycolicibacterium hodleri TaxID=49897 RepID=A0A502EIX8_9MYCO|nr:thiamine pyrophosphate-dependent dehydrogenase E1 component subunit alpha [Mycolicibacterium hodleri]TPG36456.1 thiamine pyrophosphate-dependent dehydrogenase E1 component subunit alpha [Mycolicibacterium hodleri]